MPDHQGGAAPAPPRRSAPPTRGASTNTSQATRSASSHAARAAASLSIAPSGTSSTPIASCTSPSSSAPGVQSAPGSVLPTRMPGRIPRPPSRRVPAAISCSRSVADHASRSRSSPLPLAPIRTGGSSGAKVRLPYGRCASWSASSSSRASAPSPASAPPTTDMGAGSTPGAPPRAPGASACVRGRRRSPRGCRRRR